MAPQPTNPQRFIGISACKLYGIVARWTTARNFRVAGSIAVKQTVILLWKLIATLKSPQKWPTSCSNTIQTPPCTSATKGKATVNEETGERWSDPTRLMEGAKTDEAKPI